jgi:hypothetical protein
LYPVRRSKVLAILLSLCLLSTVATQTACGEKQLSQAAEAAKDITGGTRDVIKAVGQAYQAKLITLAQKDQLADLLEKILNGSEKGITAIELLHKQGVETPTTEQRSALSKIFDNEVIAPFLEILTELGKLSDSQSVAIRAALVTMRTAIVLLSNKIGRADVIRAIEAREVWNV